MCPPCHGDEQFPRRMRTTHASTPLMRQASLHNAMPSAGRAFRCRPHFPDASARSSAPDPLAASGLRAGGHTAQLPEQEAGHPWRWPGMRRWARTSTSSTCRTTPTSRRPGGGHWRTGRALAPLMLCARPGSLTAAAAGAGAAFARPTPLCVTCRCAAAPNAPRSGPRSDASAFHRADGKQARAHGTKAAPRPSSAPCEQGDELTGMVVERDEQGEIGTSSGGCFCSWPPSAFPVQEARRARLAAPVIRFSARQRTAGQRQSAHASAMRKRSGRSSATTTR